MANKNKTCAVKKLQIEEKAAILALRDEGMSSEQIASKFGRHRSSIDRLINRSKAMGNIAIPSRQEGSGRPRKVSQALQDMVKRHIDKYPHSTAGDLKEALPELRDVSERTIRRILFSYLKLPSRTAAIKPLLTKRMKLKRLAFAKAYRHFTPEDWSKVMFSDESTFRCIRATKSKVRRPVGSDRYDARYTISSVKHPDSVMVWGGGPWGPVLLTQKHHHEWGEVPDRPGGPPVAVYGYPRQHPLPPGWGPLSCLEEDQGLPGGPAVQRHRLAGQQPGPQPH